MTRVILMNIPLKMQIILLIAKGTPLGSTCSSAVENASARPGSAQPFSLNPTQLPTGGEFSGSQSCDGDLVRTF